MNDQDFIEALVDRACPSHEKMAAAAGVPLVGNLRDLLRQILTEILSKAKAAGLQIDWWKLISLIPQIITMIQGGGSWLAIVQAILAILFPAPVAPGHP